MNKRYFTLSDGRKVSVKDDTGFQSLLAWSRDNNIGVSEYYRYRTPEGKTYNVEAWNKNEALAHPALKGAVDLGKIESEEESKRQVMETPSSAGQQAFSKYSMGGKSLSDTTAMPQSTYVETEEVQEQEKEQTQNEALDKPRVKAAIKKRDQYAEEVMQLAVSRPPAQYPDKVRDWELDYKGAVDKLDFYENTIIPLRVTGYDTAQRETIKSVSEWADKYPALAASVGQLGAGLWQLAAAPYTLITAGQGRDTEGMYAFREGLGQGLADKGQWGNIGSAFYSFGLVAPLTVGTVLSAGGTAPAWGAALQAGGTATMQMSITSDLMRDMYNDDNYLSGREALTAAMAGAAEQMIENMSLSFQTGVLTRAYKVGGVTALRKATAETVRKALIPTVKEKAIGTLMIFGNEILEENMQWGSTATIQHVMLGKPLPTKEETIAAVKDNTLGALYGVILQSGTILGVQAYQSKSSQAALLKLSETWKSAKTTQAAIDLLKAGDIDGAVAKAKQAEVQLASEYNMDDTTEAHIRRGISIIADAQNMYNVQVATNATMEVKAATREIAGLEKEKAKLRGIEGSQERLAEIEKTLAERKSDLEDAQQRIAENEEAKKIHSLLSEFDQKFEKVQAAAEKVYKTTEKRLSKTEEYKKATEAEKADMIVAELKQTPEYQEMTALRQEVPPEEVEITETGKETTEPGKAPQAQEMEATGEVEPNIETIDVLEEKISGLVKKRKTLNDGVKRLRARIVDKDGNKRADASQSDIKAFNAAKSKLRDVADEIADLREQARAQKKVAKVEEKGYNINKGEDKHGQKDETRVSSSERQEREAVVSTEPEKNMGGVSGQVDQKGKRADEKKRAEYEELRAKYNFPKRDTFALDTTIKSLAKQVGKYDKLGHQADYVDKAREALRAARKYRRLENALYGKDILIAKPKKQAAEKWHKGKRTEEAERKSSPKEISQSKLNKLPHLSALRGRTFYGGEGSYFDGIKVVPGGYLINVTNDAAKDDTDTIYELNIPTPIGERARQDRDSTEIIKAAEEEWRTGKPQTEEVYEQEWRDEMRKQEESIKELQELIDKETDTNVLSVLNAEMLRLTGKVSIKAQEVIRKAGKDIPLAPGGYPASWIRSKKELNDSQDKKRVSSEEQKGQEPVQAEPVKGKSEEAAETGGILQAQEKVGETEQTAYVKGQQEKAKKDAEHRDYSETILPFDASVRAEKKHNGRYVLLFRGTANEVFPGEEFRTPQEAHQFLKVQRLKQENSRQKTRLLEDSEQRTTNIPDKVAEDALLGMFDRDEAKVTHSGRSMTIKYKNGNELVLNRVTGALQITDRQGNIVGRAAGETKAETINGNIRVIVDLVDGYNGGNKTLFHEAFHVAWKLFMTGEQIDYVTRNFARKTGSKDIVVIEEAAANSAEEWLYKRSTSTMLGKIWQRFYDRVRHALVSLGIASENMKLKDIFTQMAQGKLAGTGTMEAGVRNKVTDIVEPDWMDDFRSVGGKVNVDGTITVYHATTQEKAEKIVKDGYLSIPPNTTDRYGVYVSSTPNISSDYGDGTVLKITVNPKDLTLDDIFGNNRMDFQIDTKQGKYTPKRIVNVPATRYKSIPTKEEYTLYQDLIRQYEEGNATASDLIYAMDENVDDETQKFIDEYKMAVYEDKEFYGERGGIPLEMEEQVLDIIEGKIAAYEGGDIRYKKLKQSDTQRQRVMARVWDEVFGEVSRNLIEDEVKAQMASVPAQLPPEPEDRAMEPYQKPAAAPKTPAGLDELYTQIAEEHGLVKGEVEKKLGTIIKSAYREYGRESADLVAALAVQGYVDTVKVNKPWESESQTFTNKEAFAYAQEMDLTLEEATEKLGKDGYTLYIYGLQRYGNFNALTRELTAVNREIERLTERGISDANLERRRGLLTAKVKSARYEWTLLKRNAARTMQAAKAMKGSDVRKLIENQESMRRQSQELWDQVAQLTRQYNEGMAYLEELENAVARLGGVVEKLVRYKRLAGDQAALDRVSAEYADWRERMAALKAQIDYVTERAQASDADVAAISKAIQITGDDTRIENIPKRKLTFYDWLKAWKYNVNMLSSLETHAVNISATALNSAMEGLVNTMMSPFSGLMGAGQWFSSLAPGGQEIEIENVKGSTAWQNVANEYNSSKLSREKFEVKATENKIFNWLQINGRVMGVEDAFFTFANLKQQLATLAVYEAHQHGEPASEWRKYYEKPTHNMMVQALYEARRACFNQNPEGLVGLFIEQVNKIYYTLENEAGTGGKVAGYALRFGVMPFTRIVGNVLNATLDYVPIAGTYRLWEYSGLELTRKNGKLAITRRQGPTMVDKQMGLKFEPVLDAEGNIIDTNPYRRRNMQRQIARQLTGTMLMSILAYAAFQHFDSDDPEDWFISGDGGSLTWAQKYQLYKGGWRPSSINLHKFGINHTLTYKEWSIAGAIGVVGNFYDSLKYGDRDYPTSATQKAATSMMGIAKSFLDRSFVSGLSDLITNLNDVNVNYLMRQTASLSPAGLANVNLLRFVNNGFDRRVEQPENMAQLAWTYVPFHSRGYAPQKVEVFGKPAQRDPIMSRIIGVSQNRDERYPPELDEAVSILHRNKLFASETNKREIQVRESAAKQERQYIRLKGKDRQEYRALRGDYYMNLLIQNLPLMRGLDANGRIDELDALKTKLGKQATRYAADKMAEKYRLDDLYHKYETYNKSKERNIE